jgi:outer membrane immunogenic protein
MTRLLLTTAALVAIAMTGAANAADLPLPPPVYRAPPPPVVYSWTGCYVAGGAGYAMWNDTNFVTGTGASQPINNSGRGWYGVGQTGCDYQFGLPLGSFWSPNVVIGAFADYGWGGNSVRGTFSSPSGIGGETMPWTWAAGARAGFLVTPKFLSYFDGGYTQANFSSVNLQSQTTGAALGTSFSSNTANGWFIGSGFEYSFDILPGLFFKTEYRYSSYNTSNLPIVVTATGAATGSGVSSTKYVQAVTSELVWRFNWFNHY